MQIEDVDDFDRFFDEALDGIGGALSNPFNDHGG